MVKEESFLVIYPLQVEDVTVSIDGRIILQDVSFSIEHAGLYTIVGPNGGGKTTIVKSILNLIRPVKGYIRIFGLPNDRYLEKEIVGYLPQRSPTREDFPIRVRDVVKMGTLKYKEKQVNKIITEALEKVEMIDFIDEVFSQLSIGQQQRVLIARAVVCKPKLLILDEPTTGLDVGSQKTFYKMIKNFVDAGMTVLMVTHDIGFVADFSDGVFCVNQTILSHQICENSHLSREFFDKLYGYGVRPIIHKHGEAND